MESSTPPLHNAFVRALETLPLGVTVADPEGRILFTNPAEAAMHGWEVDDLLGKPTRIFQPPWAATTAGPGSLKEVGDWTRRRRNRRKDGSTFPVHLRSTVVLDGQGEPSALVTVSEDRTRRVEAPARESGPDLTRDRLNLMGQWALGVAHDFSNIVMVVGGSLDAIVESPDLADRIELASRLQEQVDRAHGLIRWLKDVSRGQETRLEQLDLAQVVDRFADYLRRLLPGEVRLAIFHDGLLPPVRADAILLQEVLMNLVTNSRDAMPDGGLITLTTSMRPAERPVRGRATKEATRACITVTDTGMGIDASDQERVFDSFYTTKASGVGSGLGLPFVRSIMNQLEGDIQLRSVPGGGTSVTVLVPLWPGHPDDDDLAS